MKTIKNIIFDLGGVFIAIDYSKTEKAFEDKGVSNFKEMFNQHHASDLFEKLETGKYSPEDFFDAFRSEARVELSNEEIESSWNAMLGNFYDEHLQWLETVKLRYNIYLFSNTNLIHYRAFQYIYKQQTGKTNLDDYFVKAYYSHDLGLRKPYPGSFRAVLQKEGLLAEETLFIDDTLKNIEGANSVGLNTIYLENAEDLINKVANI